MSRLAYRSNAGGIVTGPLSFVNSAYVAPTGSTIHVASGGNLQAAIDAASPGDQITIEAGATFTGPFFLRHKTSGGSAPIIIRSDAANNLLPAEGVRVQPTDASHLPKLVAAVGDLAVIWTDAQAANWRLMFLEVCPVAANDLNTLVRIGSGAADQFLLSQCPSNIILDRSYLHGLTTTQTIRGVQVHGAYIGIVDCCISEIHAVGADSQAVVGWNGPGPYKITNNLLSAAGENVMFGGADPVIPNLVAADIEMRRNYIWKDPAWNGSSWSVKNHLEFKCGRRALIKGNIFENCWIAAQTGLSILFKSTNQSGGFPNAVVENIIFRSNIIRRASSGITIPAMDGGHTSLVTNTILVDNNLFETIADGNTTGLGVSLSGAEHHLDFEHNTLIFSGTGGGNTTLQMDSISPGLPRSTAITFKNNVLARAANFGVLGLVSGGGEGAPSLATYNVTWQGNVLPGVAVPPYSLTGGNQYPSLMTAVYPNWATFDYTMAAPFQGTATDGTNPGVDFVALGVATAGVLAGSAET